MADVAPADPGARRRLPAWLKSLFSILLGGGLLLGVLPRLADLGEVWAVIGDLSVMGIVVIGAAATWNILTYQFVMMSALPGLRWRHAFMTGQIATAVSNTLPAGAVVGIGVTYSVLSSFGHGTAAIALTSIITGFWNTLAKFAMPTVALFVLALNGEVNEGLLSAAGIGAALLVGATTVLVMVVSSEAFARRIGAAVQRFVSSFLALFGRREVSGWEESFARFRWRSAALLKRRWHLLTLATAVSHVSLFWVLLAALRQMGVEPGDVHWYEALGVFAFVQLATALPITPGGIGLVEVGMSAGLVLAGGNEPAVVAAVLLYRSLTYLLQVVLGIGCYAVWRTLAGRVGPPQSQDAGVDDSPPS
jgi:uncharacterized protein (TIRG00374 family)